MAEETGRADRRVNVVEYGYLPPADETPEHTIWLSNIDLAANRKCYTPVIYLYPGDGTAGFFDSGKLKSALARALVQYHPFAGEFGYDPDGRLEIRCTGKGVYFVEASCELTLEEFGDFTPGLALQSLLLPKAVASAEPPCPLMLLQVTRFKCGCVSLATSVHHIMGDGTSTLQFISAWAEIARGGDHTSMPRLLLDRRILKGRSPPRIEFDHKEYDFCSPNASDAAPERPKPSTSRVFLLSKAQAAKLKAEGDGATTFSVVMSHAWRTACKARRLPAELPTRIFMTTDIRSRLEPPLPAGFLGNAALPTKVEAAAGEVACGAIGGIARMFEEAKRRFQDAYFRSLIDFLETTPVTERVRLGPGDLVAVNWMNLPIYQLDFGWGPPSYIQRAVLPACGMVYVMRNLGGEQGSLMVTVALEEEYMEDYAKIFHEDIAC